MKLCLQIKVKLIRNSAVAPGPIDNDKESN